MESSIRALAALEPGLRLETFEYVPEELAPDEVEVAVRYCGICHSDLSMLRNDWGLSNYPLVPGHEIVGTVTALGDEVTTLEVGQTVGVGWMAESCLSCRQCLGGQHNLCPQGQGTIVRRHGGFADRVRCQAVWAFPLPSGLDAASAGPLFCGGITVFSPLVEYNVQPTDRVGVIGIGGLGHLALQFLNKWGCEVVAFTSSKDKRDEALKLGAHRVINSRDDARLAEAAGTLDFILATVNVPLNWELYLRCLAPGGRLHMVGALLEPMAVNPFKLIGGQKSISGSPTGSPASVMKMLEFCARHSIAPATESFAMTQANEALEHLERGGARYRIVLENDLA